MYRWANLRANVAAVARSGPTECVAFFGNAVSSMTNTASAPPTSLSVGFQSHAPMVPGALRPTLLRCPISPDTKTDIKP